MFQPNEILMYLRKSRADDPALSVEEVLLRHEEILDNWCARHIGGIVPPENRFREVVSGETLDDRPQMLALLRAIESPGIKAVLTVEVQRLSRGDLEDAGRLIKLLRYTDTCVITPQKTYDINNEFDRDFFERELKRGNEFLEYQKKIMSRGRLLSVQQGNYIASQPPYGYDKVWVSDGQKKCPTLKINEEQANVVRMIFDMYVNEDMGRASICRRLDALGIKPPRGENWSPSGLKDTLENVHYIGKVRWNWRKTVTVIEDGEVIKTNPKAKAGEYLVYDGKHEPIISEELFMRAMEKQGRNHRAKAETKIRNPLAGLLYCHCGRAMSLRMYKKNGVERAPARLICDNQPNCKTPSCLFDEMLTLVCRVLERYIEDFEFKTVSDDKPKELRQNLVESLEKKLKTLEAKELSRWEAQSDPDPELRMPEEIFKKLNEKLKREKEITKAALEIATEELNAEKTYEEKAASFKNALNALKNPNVSAQEKNRLLKSCIERITYSRDKSEIDSTLSPAKIDVTLKV